MIGIVLGFGVFMVALPICIVVAGGGHGSYIPAKLLFPFTMLLTIVRGSGISAPMMAIGVIQFPLYGWTIERSRKSLWGILSVHAVAVLACWLLDSTSTWR